MKVLYLAELDPFGEVRGGGEFILSEFIRRGREMGAEVVTRCPRDNVAEISNYIKNWADFAIVADSFNRPSIQSWFPHEIYHEIFKNLKYATFDTGYSSFCNRDYTPCNLSGKNNCPDCPKKDGLRLKLYEEATERIFLSPLHRDTAKQHMKFSGDSYICIPEIDLSMFYDMGLERDIDYIVCGVICHAKGYFDIIDYIEKHSLQDKKIVFVGPSLVGPPKYGEWVQKIPREEMPSFMNRAKNAIGLSQWREAFGLWAAETKLCGCNIISNKNLGALSCFDYDQEKMADSNNYINNYSVAWECLFDKMKS